MMVKNVSLLFAIKVRFFDRRLSKVAAADVAWHAASFKLGHMVTN